MIKCALCERVFSRFNNLGIHLKRSHKSSTKEYYDMYLKKKTDGICAECGKETSFIGLQRGYFSFCSLKCSNNSKKVQEKKEQTCLEHFKVRNPLQSIENKNKAKQTCIEKYGVAYPSQTKQFQENRKKTCMCKYGFTHHAQTEQGKQVRQEACLKKYGVKNPFQASVIQEKIRITNIKKYGVAYPSQRLEHREATRTKMKAGQAAYMCSLNKSPSKPQIKLFNLIRSLYNQTILNLPIKVAQDKSYCIDIAILDLKIAVEYDGAYWHQNKDRDRLRQEEIETFGWRFLRYEDLPSLEQLQEHINNVIEAEN